MGKVLVVDDDLNQGRALALGLRLEGFEVRTAINGQAALSLLAADAAEIAIVDLMLPGMNGMELSRQLRELHPELRVILSSAYHLSERQLIRSDCGVIAFLPKPYDLPELTTFLRAKLASSPESCRIAMNEGVAHVGAGAQRRTANSEEGAPKVG